jgi:hypothetical protein
MSISCVAVKSWSHFVRAVANWRSDRQATVKWLFFLSNRSRVASVGARSEEVTGRPFVQQLASLRWSCNSAFPVRLAATLGVGATQTSEGVSAPTKMAVARAVYPGTRPSLYSQPWEPQILLFRPAVSGRCAGRLLSRFEDWNVKILT